MKYNIQSPFNLSESDRSMIEDKLDSLEKFNLGISSVEIFLKEDDGTNPDDIHAQIRVFLPGPDIFAEKFPPTGHYCIQQCIHSCQEASCKIK